MKSILCALLVLRVATGHSIITKSMLHSMEEPSLEPVQLQTKPPEAVTERLSRIRQTPEELLRSLGYIRSEEHFEGRDVSDDDLDLTAGETSEDDDYYTDTTPVPYTTSIPEFPTKFLQITRREDTTIAGSTHNRTKLYPVGRLWERTMPPRPLPGFMAILDAAFSCLWSGLGFECFSLKVVPMFRAMMGFPPLNPFGHPYYVLPRTADVAESEEDEADEQDQIAEDSKVLFLKNGRRRRRRRFWGLKLVKGAMIGLAAVKTLLIPALSVLSIVSGKAIVFSLAAVVLTIAAGWSNAKSADRRVYNSQASDTQYYM